MLAVEDNAILARPLTRFLVHSGYEVTYADSCARARALNESFDVGVFDIDLSDGSGIDLCLELLARSVVRNAVFYTGVIESERLISAARIATVVRKTQSAEALRQAICSALALNTEIAQGACCSSRRA